ncbi:MAG: 4Fe-4S ferredoxin [Desulfobacteraceae bacterium]|nr:MAG: 4Fe-4S ferredoxin [Desulfobacteraceae bacterium]
MSAQTLYQQLAAAVGAGDSKYIPQIFEILTDEKAARLLLAASPPATVQELAGKAGLSEAEIEQRVGPLFSKGLLFKSKKADGTRYYRVRQVIQMHDATAVALDAPRAMLDLWKTYMAEEFPTYNRMVEEVLPRAAVRVVPVNQPVTAQSQILAFDDIRNIVEQARSLAVTACSCRRIDGSCGKPVEVCFQLDKAADYSIERGTGRPIDKEEVLKLIRQCEQEGLIHVSDNTRAPGHVICNCCSDCCLFWTSFKTGLGKFVAPSRFSARVDAERCSACETCLERCYFDAIAMQGENDTALVNPDKCMGCGLCQVTCPEEAIALKEVRPEAFIPG